MKDVFNNGDVWLALAVVLGAGLIALSLFFNAGGSAVPEKRSEQQLPIGKSRVLSARVSPTDMYKDFVCSCCGKSIGECTCGMAGERRAKVNALAAQGLSKREIYKEMVREYAEGILFDAALAAEIKKELIAEAPADRPIVSVEPQSFDAGEVSMAKGEATATYTVSNVGKTTLEISGLETSCMCTTAVLKQGREESPVFGMHDNPTDWSTSVKPGERAQLIVTFDPNAHGPEATGPVTRDITIFSNDEIDSAKKVRFEADVVK